MLKKIMQDPALPGLHRYTVQYNTVHNVYNYVVTFKHSKIFTPVSYSRKLSSVIIFGLNTEVAVERVVKNDK